MERQHFFHSHPLKLNLFRGIINYPYSVPYCKGCGEGILGISYNCKRCDFFLHKSCGEQPRKLQHPLHPQHPLIMLLSIRSKQSYFCSKKILRGYTYHCFHCNFNLHLKCASYPFTVKAEFHDHPLKLLRKSVSFTCDACGKEDKDMSYLCIDVTCPLMVHLKCAALPLIVKNTSHHHALNLTHSSQLNQSHRRICRICVKKVDTEKVYYCSKCNFIAHLDCATCEGYTDETFMLEFKDKQPLELTGMLKNEDSKLDESMDALAYVVKKKKIGEDKIEIDEEINHFSHQHDLKLTYDQLQYNEKCNGCRHLIFPPFYSCAQCRFFLHKSCIALPKKKQHPLHPHLLTLLRKATYGDFICNVCGRECDGFTYRCVKCEFDADVKCSLISDIITHDSHEHQLILSRASYNEKCSCCDYNAKGGVFRCADSEDGSDGEYYCDICEKERNPKHWFYYCEELNFPAHSKCILGTYIFDVVGML
ncbi:uncharacterized protein LOC132168946 [Corylus avellana]|uniref:uncharacterized protein LOC132168946 n=1 Tax=Corylus avellana TaxID=13451 RepID=UPI00286BD74D|nr:uncharacterized protein LOC132168946 [Corylus avellana]